LFVKIAYAGSSTDKLTTSLPVISGAFKNAQNEK
jgi:hypothetical protein